MLSNIGLGLFILCLNFVTKADAQSCPAIANVAQACVAGTYTGERVLLDMSSFTPGEADCACSFTTDSNVLKIVTYNAPNYQDCNSAVRLASSSGNSVRFQCLMSGTYLDTSVHNTGNVTLETSAAAYDTNYCLVLEHAGLPGASITITCNGPSASSFQPDMSTTVVSSGVYDITTAGPAADTEKYSTTASTDYTPESSNATTQNVQEKNTTNVQGLSSSNVTVTEVPASIVTETPVSSETSQTFNSSSNETSTVSTGSSIIPGTSSTIASTDSPVSNMSSSEASIGSSNTSSSTLSTDAVVNNSTESSTVANTSQNVTNSSYASTESRSTSSTTDTSTDSGTMSSIYDKSPAPASNMSVELTIHLNASDESSVLPSETATLTPLNLTSFEQGSADMPNGYIHYNSIVNTTADNGTLAIVPEESNTTEAIARVTDIITGTVLLHGSDKSGKQYKHIDPVKTSMYDDSINTTGDALIPPEPREAVGMSFVTEKIPLGAQNGAAKEIATVSGAFRDTNQLQDMTTNNYWLATGNSVRRTNTNQFADGSSGSGMTTNIYGLTDATPVKGFTTDKNGFSGAFNNGITNENMRQYASTPVTDFTTDGNSFSVSNSGALNNGMANEKLPQDTLINRDQPVNSFTTDINSFSASNSDFVHNGMTNDNLRQYAPVNTDQYAPDSSRMTTQSRDFGKFAGDVTTSNYAFTGRHYGNDVTSDFRTPGTNPGSLPTTFNNEQMNSGYRNEVASGGKSASNSYNTMTTSNYAYTEGSMGDSTSNNSNGSLNMNNTSNNYSYWLGNDSAVRGTMNTGTSDMSTSSQIISSGGVTENMRASTDYAQGTQSWQAVTGNSDVVQTTYTSAAVSHGLGLSTTASSMDGRNTEGVDKTTGRSDTFGDGTTLNPYNNIYDKQHSDLTNQFDYNVNQNVNSTQTTDKPKALNDGPTMTTAYNNIDRRISNEMTTASYGLTKGNDQNDSFDMSGNANNVTHDSSSKTTNSDLSVEQITATISESGAPTTDNKTRHNEPNMGWNVTGNILESETGHTINETTQFEDRPFGNTQMPDLTNSFDRTPNTTNGTVFRESNPAKTTEYASATNNETGVQQTTDSSRGFLVGNNTENYTDTTDNKPHVDITTTTYASIDAYAQPTSQNDFTFDNTNNGITADTNQERTTGSFAASNDGPSMPTTGSYRSSDNAGNVVTSDRPNVVDERPSNTMYDPYGRYVQPDLSNHFDNTLNDTTEIFPGKTNQGGVTNNQVSAFTSEASYQTTDKYAYFDRNNTEANETNNVLVGIDSGFTNEIPTNQYSTMEKYPEVDLSSHFNNTIHSINDTINGSGTIEQTTSQQLGSRQLNNTIYRNNDTIDGPGTNEQTTQQHSGASSEPGVANTSKYDYRLYDRNQLVDTRTDNYQSIGSERVMTSRTDVNNDYNMPTVTTMSSDFVNSPTSTTSNDATTTVFGSTEQTTDSNTMRSAHGHSTGMGTMSTAFRQDGWTSDPYPSTYKTPSTKSLQDTTSIQTIGTNQDNYMQNTMDSITTKNPSLTTQTDVNADAPISFTNEGTRLPSYTRVDTTQTNTDADRASYTGAPTTETSYFAKQNRGTTNETYDYTAENADTPEYVVGGAQIPDISTNTTSTQPDGQYHTDASTVREASLPLELTSRAKPYGSGWGLTDSAVPETTASTSYTDYSTTRKDNIVSSDTPRTDASTAPPSTYTEAPVYVSGPSDIQSTRSWDSPVMSTGYKIPDTTSASTASLGATGTVAETTNALISTEAQTARVYNPLQDNTTMTPEHKAFAANNESTANDTMENTSVGYSTGFDKYSFDHNVSTNTLPDSYNYNVDISNNNTGEIPRTNYPPFPNFNDVKNTTSNTWFTGNEENTNGLFMNVYSGAGVSQGTHTQESTSSSPTQQSMDVYKDGTTPAVNNAEPAATTPYQHYRLSHETKPYDNTPMNDTSVFAETNDDNTTNAYQDVGVSNETLNTTVPDTYVDVSVNNTMPSKDTRISGDAINDTIRNIADITTSGPAQGISSFSNDIYTKSSKAIPESTTRLVVEPTVAAAYINNASINPVDTTIAGRVVQNSGIVDGVTSASMNIISNVNVQSGMKQPGMVTTDQTVTESHRESTNLPAINTFDINISQPVETKVVDGVTSGHSNMINNANIHSGMAQPDGVTADQTVTESHRESTHLPAMSTLDININKPNETNMIDDVTSRNIDMINNINVHSGIMQPGGVTTDQTVTESHTENTHLSIMNTSDINISLPVETNMIDGVTSRNIDMINNVNVHIGMMHPVEVTTDKTVTESHRESTHLSAMNTFDIHISQPAETNINITTIGVHDGSTTVETTSTPVVNTDARFNLTYSDVAEYPSSNHEANISSSSTANASLPPTSAQASDPFDRMVNRGNIEPYTSLVPTESQQTSKTIVKLESTIDTSLPPLDMFPTTMDAIGEPGITLDETETPAAVATAPMVEPEAVTETIVTETMIVSEIKPVQAKPIENGIPSFDPENPVLSHGSTNLLSSNAVFRKTDVYNTDVSLKASTTTSAAKTPSITTEAMTTVPVNEATTTESVTRSKTTAQSTITTESITTQSTSTTPPSTTITTTTRTTTVQPTPARIPPAIVAKDSVNAKDIVVPDSHPPVIEARPVTRRPFARAPEDTTPGPAVDMTTRGKDINVSFGDNYKAGLFEMDNSTTIIVVASIAALVVLAVIMGICIHHSRRGRSEKVDISGGGLEPISHKNIAFENIDPEKGHAGIPNEANGTGPSLAANGNDVSQTNGNGYKGSIEA